MTHRSTTLPLSSLSSLLESTVRVADQPQVEPLLAVARDLQAAHEALPQLLQVVERFSDTLAQGKSEHPAVRARFDANLLASGAALYTAVAGLYPSYRSARERCEQASAFWGLGVDQEPLGGSLEGFAGPSRASLLSALKTGLDALQRDAKKLALDDAATALRDAAHRPPTDAKGRKRVIDDGMDALERFGVLFPRTLGLLRRVNLLVDAGAQDPWTSSVVWRGDAVVGGRES